MFDATTSQTASDIVDALATDVLRDLYRAVCGHDPAAVRAYRDDDALLLLIRFESDDAQAGTIAGFGPPLDVALLTMPGLIAAALAARAGQRLVPGNLSVCPERGFAVMAFSVMEDEIEQCSDEDLFRIDTEAFSGLAGGRPKLRLAS